MRLLGLIKTYVFDLKKAFDMNRYYKMRSDPWTRSTSLAEIKAAIGLVNDRRYANCLDIGTGLGYFAEEISSFCDYCLAIDISKEAIRKATSRLPGTIVEFKVANVRKFKPKNKFDLVICGDVLYYLGDILLSEEFNKLLAKISSWVNDGGRILLTHGALPSRDRDWLQNNYIKKFEDNGFRIEKHETFTQDNIIWLHIVLAR